MKLCRLDLLAFGSLRDVSLDLESVGPCLHVIYGPNEAGKSTALRALSGLFYGIAPNTRDAHSIEPEKLRVGAELCDAAGRRLQVVRRKGRKDTLLGQDGRPLPESEAAWIAGGVAESTFHSLFGLSFATLHSGAEELLGSAGDLGQSLFSAAYGGGRVRQVLEQLEQEAAELWKRRGKLQHLNVAFSLYETAKRKVRDDGVKSITIVEQQAAKERAEADSLRLQAEIQALRASRVQLERARRVLPLLDKLQKRQAESRALGEVPQLSLEAASGRREADAARRDARVRLDAAEAEIHRLEQELAAEEARVRRELTGLHPSEVDALRDRLGEYRRCLRALPAKRTDLERARAEVERARKQLQLPELDLSPAGIERLRLPRQLEARVREQLQSGTALRARLADLRRAAADKRDQLERSQQKLWELWGKQPKAPLLARTALPSEAVCSEFDRVLRELAESARLLVRKREDAESELERNLREREALALVGVPPTESELSFLRASRDAAWRELREQLDAGGGRALAASALPLFERAMRMSEQVDGLADRLWREAERVTVSANLTAEQRSLERKLEKLTAEVGELQARTQAHSAAWSAHFRAAGLPVRSVQETQGLLGAQAALLLRAEEIERELAKLERELAAQREAEERWSQAWQALAGELGVGSSVSVAELEALLDARSELLSRHDAERALDHDVERLVYEQAEFEAVVAQLSAQYMPELVGAEPELAAQRLIDAHRTSVSAHTRATRVRAALSERKQAAEAAERAAIQAERSLAALMQAANVTDLLALEAAEQRASRAAALQAEQRDLHDELAAASDGQDPEAIAAAVDCSLDEVIGRLRELDEQLEQLDEQRQRAIQEAARCREGLALLYDNHAAGDAAAEALTHLEQVRTLTQRYVRVRLAAAVLEREIERYRERHRAPVLQAAAEMFEKLTLGAYSGLDVDYGIDDKPALVCVRADDKHVSVEGLSTGARDQLYLALRLASIAHLSTRKEPMPLILDDILVHFDDERARAALVLLAEFAATTQVLFFTHHQRLCELVVQAVPAQRVRMHHLAYTRPAPALAVLRV